MSIYGLGLEGKKNADMWKLIHAAIGHKDENGIPFEIIEVQATVMMGSYAKTRGFEDTFVEVDEESGEFRIFHRRPGKITWIKPEYGRWRIGFLAKTPFNMQVLASIWFDDTLIIKDPITKAEVVAMAKRLEEGWTEKEREFHALRRKSMKERPDVGMLPPLPGKRSEEVGLEQLEHALDKRQAELIQREQKILEKEKELAARAGQQVSEGIKPVQYTRESLKAMGSQPKVLKIAREMGLHYPNSTTMEDIIQGILKLQRGENPLLDPKKDPVVTEEIGA